MVQFSPHNKHPVIVLRKEAWRICLLYPSAAKDSYCCHPTGWVGGQRGHHEVSDCNNLSQTKSPHACKDNGCAGIVVVCKRVIVIKSEV